MPWYFYPLEPTLFHDQVHPALAASWRLRSFAPCTELCRAFLERVRAFQQEYRGLEDATLVEQVARGLAFDKDRWRCLAGELLLFGAADWPVLEVPEGTLGHLL